MLHCTRINWLLVFFFAAHMLQESHPDVFLSLVLQTSHRHWTLNIPTLTEKKVKTYSCCGMLTAAFDFLEEKLRTVPVFGHYSTNSCRPPQPSSATLAPHAEQVSYQRCCSELAPIFRLWVLSLSKWEQLERGTLSLSLPLYYQSTDTRISVTLIPNLKFHFQESLLYRHAPAFYARVPSLRTF